MIIEMNLFVIDRFPLINRDFGSNNLVAGASGYLMCNKIWTFFQKKQLFMSFPYVLPFHVILQFSNSLRHSSSIDQQKRLLAEFPLFIVYFSCLFCTYPMNFFGKGFCLSFYY